MKKLALAVAVMALALGGTAAKADLFDYTQLYGGITADPSLDSPNSLDVDRGYNVGGALGWNFGPDFSADIDFFYTTSDFSTLPVTIESFSFMADVYYTFDFDSRFKPFVGVGIGGVQVTVDAEDFGGVSDSSIVFGYQAMAGFTVNVAENIDLLAEYRYQGAEDATLEVFPGSPYDQEYKSHNFSAGFRFHL